MIQRSEKRTILHTLVLLTVLLAVLMASALVLGACTQSGSARPNEKVTTTTTTVLPIDKTTTTTRSQEKTDKDKPTTTPTVTEKPGDNKPTLTTSALTTKPAITTAPEREPEPVLMERGSKSDDVMALQKRLIELNFMWDEARGSFGANTEKAVTVFQKYAGMEQTGKVTQSFLDLLYSDNAPVAEVTYDHEDVIDPDRKTDYYIIVYNDNCRVLVLGKDDFNKYNVVVKSFICSVGVKAEDDEGTPAGLFAIEKRYEWRTLFGHNGYKYVYGQYACRFNGNYLFHSVPYIKNEQHDTLEMEEFEKLGTAASAGCVRLCVRDAKWIYDNAENKTQVRVVDGKYGPEEYEPIPELLWDEQYNGWDPTDPNENNPYKKEEDQQ